MSYIGTEDFFLEVASEKSDIWFEAYGDGAATSVSIDFELLLVDN